MLGESTPWTTESAQTIISSLLSGNTTQLLSSEELTELTDSVMSELPEEAKALFIILKSVAEKVNLNLSDISLENAGELARKMQGTIMGLSMDDVAALPENTLHWLKDGGLKQIAQNVTFLQMAFLAYSMYRNIRAGNKQDASFDAAGIAARMSGFNFTSLGGLGFLTEFSKGIATLARGEYVLGFRHLGESVNKLAAFLLPTLSIYGGATIATWLASPSALFIAIPAVGYIAYKGWQYAKSYALGTWQEKALRTLSDRGFQPDELMKNLSLCNDPNFLIKVLSNKQVLNKASELWMAQRYELLARSPHFAKPLNAIGQMIAFVAQTDDIANKLYQHSETWLQDAGLLETLESAVGKDNVKKYGLQLITQLQTLSKMAPSALKTFLDADPKRKVMLAGTFSFITEVEKNPLFKSAVEILVPDWERLKKEIYEPIRKELEKEFGKRKSPDINLVTPEGSKPLLFSGSSVPGPGVGVSSLVQSNGCSLTSSWNWANPLSMILPNLSGRRKHPIC
ncbi:MAG: hypothetical protein U1E78_06645 [Gammaproteobacteria bacterium]